MAQGDLKDGWVSKIWQCGGHWLGQAVCAAGGWQLAARARACVVERHTARFRTALMSRLGSFARVGLTCMQALCINDDVLRLQSASLINERCLELQKPGTGGSKKAAAVAGGSGGGGGADATAVGPQRKVCTRFLLQEVSALVPLPPYPTSQCCLGKALLCRLPRAAPAAAAGARSWLAARRLPPPLVT